MSRVDELIGLVKNADHIIAGAVRSGHLHQICAMFGVAAEEARYFQEYALALFLTLARAKASCAGFGVKAKSLVNDIIENSDDIAIAELVEETPWPKG